MKIMITGATGFIGNNLLRQLLRDDNKINILYRNEISDQMKISSVNLIKGDIMDLQSIEKCMDGCSEVYHLAAYAKNWAAKKDIFFDSNCLAVKNILDAAVKRKVRRVLFMSTSVTFGPSDGQSVNESTKRIIQPLTDYESSKIAAEKIVEDFLEKDISIVTVNPTRLFGPGLMTEGNSVTRMIDLYLKGKFRFILGSGDAIGNYAFIDDVVKGCILAMKNGTSGEKYILGGGNLSYNELFLLISAISVKKFRMIHIPESIGIAYGNLEKLVAKISNHYPSITSEWVRTFSLDWAFSSDKAVRELNYTVTPPVQAFYYTIKWLSSFNNQGADYESFKFA